MIRLRRQVCGRLRSPACLVSVCRTDRRSKNDSHSVCLRYYQAETDSAPDCSATPVPSVRCPSWRPWRPESGYTPRHGFVADTDTPTKLRPWHDSRASAPMSSESRLVDMECIGTRRQPPRMLCPDYRKVLGDISGVNVAYASSHASRRVIRSSMAAALRIALVHENGSTRLHILHQLYGLDS